MKIKICGITAEQEVEWLNDAGVDYAGFVLFFEKSRRNLPLARAAELIRKLAPTIIPVAVTVEPTREQIREMEQAGFGILQIHGEIADDAWEDIHIPVWKAFNVSDLSKFSDYEARRQVVGYVFDAQTPGSGKTFDWSLLERLPKTEKQVMLAGGLNPENVKLAIEKCGALLDGVDTSSGVENDSGWGKNREKIERFVKRGKNHVTGRKTQK